MLTTLRTGLDELPSELARFGGSMQSGHALVGQYDAAVIADFEELEGVLAFSLSATAQGQEVEVLPAYGQGELQRAEAIAREASESFTSDLAMKIERAESGEEFG